MVARNHILGSSSRLKAIRRVCLATGIAMLVPTAPRAQDTAEYIGDPRFAEITLAVPIMPTYVDMRSRLQPPVARWLAYIAERAAVRLQIQPASFDRRVADMAHKTNHCVLGHDRVPSREAGALWLAPMGQDRILFIARRDDPFNGDIDALMSVLPDHVAAPSGIYRELLALRDIPHVAVDDQRSLARMVEAGRVRFGMLIGATLETAEVRSMALRVVAAMPPLDFWFACSRDLPPALAGRLTNALTSENAQRLRHLAMKPPPTTGSN